jgi:hypothetical protein
MRNASLILVICLLPACSDILNAPPDDDLLPTGETTVWRRITSPVEILDSLIVPLGQTLVIEPGVDVLFSDSADVVIHGRLVAIGTETDSIRFLPASGGTWSGLHFSSPDTSTLSYVRVSGASASGVANYGYTWEPFGTAGKQSHYPVYANLLISHSVISHNTGHNGAGLAAYGRHITLEHCTFRANRAQYDGGAVAVASATLRNCIIADNIAGARGAALVVYGGDISMQNCVVTRNSSSSGETLFFTHRGSLNLTNCVVWSNPVQHVFGGTGQFAAVYSDVQGGYQGMGNIDADPLFVDPERGDFQLDAGSPCTEAGDPYQLDTDGTRSDMGVYDGSGQRLPQPIIEISSNRILMASGQPRTVFVHNHGTGMLVVAGIELPVDFSTSVVFPQEIAPGDSLGINITYAGTQEHITHGAIHHSDLLRLPISVELRVLRGTGVSGDASGEWAVEGSPYRIFGDVFVRSGKRLDIGPGVEVRFDTTAQFNVEGEIHVHGTATDSVRIIADPRYRQRMHIYGEALNTFSYVRLIGEGIYVWGAQTSLEMSHSVLDDGDPLRYSEAIGFFTETGTLTMANCRISSANSNGAVRTSGGTVALTDCIIRDNQRRGLDMKRSTVTANGCTIADNGGEGVTVWGSEDDSFEVHFSDCRISGNRDGGVSLFGNLVTFTDCVVEGNVKGYLGAGIAMQNRRLEMTRCAITGNVSSYEGGGAFYCQGDSTILVDCTIQGNQAAHEGGAFYITSEANGGGVRLVNSTVTGNSEPQFYTEGTSTGILRPGARAF